MSALYGRPQGAFTFLNEAHFTTNFGAKTAAYFNIFKHVPLNGVHLEEVLFRALWETDGVNRVEWRPNSHIVGRDIAVNGIRISVKSCGLPKKEEALMEYSSYRTTKLKTIQEKIAYCDADHYDTIICLARNEIVKDGDHYTHYSLREVSHPSMLSEMDWTEDDVNYTGLHPNWKAVIRKSRSDQLLIHIPLSHTRVIMSFDVKREIY